MLSEYPIELLYNEEINKIKSLQKKINLGCSPLPVVCQIEDEALQVDGQVEVTYCAKAAGVEIKQKYALDTYKRP